MVNQRTIQFVEYTYVYTYILSYNMLVGFLVKTQGLKPGCSLNAKKPFSEFCSLNGEKY